MESETGLEFETVSPMFKEGPQLSNSKVPSVRKAFFETDPRDLATSVNPSNPTATKGTVLRQRKPLIHSEIDGVDETEEKKMKSIDQSEVASSFYGDDGKELNENFRKELERLQIATIYSLVEQVIYI